MIPSPLRQRAIRRLVSAYAVNQIGDWAAEMALAVVVFEATGSAAAVAATWVVHRASLAVCAPWAVARLEALPRTRVLIALYLLQAAFFCGVIAVGVSAPWAVLSLLAADGLVAPSARSLARTSLVAVAEPQGLLRETNGIVNVVFTVNGVLAPVLGGLMVAAVGPRVALGVDVGSFLLAAVLVAGIELPATATGPRHALERLGAAVRYARAAPLIGRLLVADAFYWLFIAAITPIEVAFVCGTLEAGSDALGAVLAAWGAGMIAGGIAAARLRSTPLPALLAIAATTQAIAFLGMGVSSSVGQVLIWSAIGGVGNGGYGMAYLTALQERTPSLHQACVNALYETIGSVAPGLGFMAGGLLAVLASPRAVYLVAGLGALAVVGATAAALRSADWSPPPLAQADPTR